MNIAYNRPRWVLSLSLTSFMAMGCIGDAMAFL